MKYRIHATNTSLGVDPAENILRVLAVWESIDAHREEIGGGFRDARARLLLLLQIAEHNYRVRREGAALHALQRAFRENANDNSNFILDWLASQGSTEFEEWFVMHLPELGRPARAILLRKIERARKIGSAYSNELYALHRCEPRWHLSRILRAINYRRRNFQQHSKRLSPPQE
jgi:hypothetical protein